MEPAVTAPASRDVGRFLGIVGPWAWALFGLYTAVFALIAVVVGVPRVGLPVTAASLALILAAAFLVASPSPTPMRLPRLLAIAGLCVAGVAVMLLDLPTQLGYESLATWPLVAVNFLLFVIELRARIAEAWLLLAVIVVMVATWSLVRTGDPWLGLQLTYGQAVSLAAGTIFAIGLRRTVRQIFAQQDAERARAGVEAARRVGDAHRAAELADVRAIAGPLLRRIARGEAVDRREALSLEAALRDRIRGRGLAVEPLVSALARARDRDIDALLLDDLGDSGLGEEQAVAVARWCALRLDRMSGPRVTIRLAPGPRGAVVSIADADGIVGELAVPVVTGAQRDPDPSSARRVGLDGADI
jgi:hypothetical protein